MSLNDLDFEEAYLSPAIATESDPARDFELRWALTVLDRVMQRLRDEFVKHDRAELFDGLEAHLLGDVDSVPFSELSGRFGVSVANVKTIALRLRRRYQLLLRDEIAQTVAQPGEIDEELRYLMRIVSQ